MHPIGKPQPDSARPSGATPQAPHGHSAKLIRLSAVEALTSLKRSSIYAGQRAGTFPGSVRLSARAVAWREAEVLAWCAARTKTGDTNAGA